MSSRQSPFSPSPAGATGILSPLFRRRPLSRRHPLLPFRPASPSLIRWADSEVPSPDPVRRRKRRAARWAGAAGEPRANGVRHSGARDGATSRVSPRRAETEETEQQQASRQRRRGSARRRRSRSSSRPAAARRRRHSPQERTAPAREQDCRRQEQASNSRPAASKTTKQGNSSRRLGSPLVNPTVRKAFPDLPRLPEAQRPNSAPPHTPRATAMLPALRPLRRIPLAHLRSRLSSSSTSGEGVPPAVASTDEAVAAAKLREEAYKQVANLDWSSNADFWKAVDIVKTLPPKRKEFGLDFHLVQLFFVCLPSLAVYLVAQYARREIKRMEAEAEEKKKKDEELEKEKQLEADSVKDETDSKLSAVLVRLDTLEGVVNEIVDDKRKGSVPGVSNKEEAMKKGKTQSSASDKEVVPVKSKDIIGATNASPNSTQQSPTGNGDKASSDPKG